jgi:hypothetical protein
MRAGLLFVVFLSVSWVPMSSMADQDVFRCGQEITNKPVDASVCQKLVPSGAVQVEGTRVQISNPPKPPVSEKGDSLVQDVRARVAKPDAPTIQARHQQARTILEDEWQKLSAKHAELVRTYNHGRPVLMAGEESGHSMYKQRVEGLQTNLQRTERDLQALRRELSRYPPN